MIIDFLYGDIILGSFNIRIGFVNLVLLLLHLTSISIIFSSLLKSNIKSKLLLLLFISPPIYILLITNNYYLYNIVLINFICIFIYRLTNSIFFKGVKNYGIYLFQISILIVLSYLLYCFVKNNFYIDIINQGIIDEINVSRGYGGGVLALILFNKLLLIPFYFFRWLQELSVNSFFSSRNFNIGSYNIELSLFTKVMILPFIWGIYHTINRSLKPGLIATIFIFIISFPLMFVETRFILFYQLSVIPFYFYFINFGFELFNRKIQLLLLIFSIIEMVLYRVYA